MKKVLAICILTLSLVIGSGCNTTKDSLDISAGPSLSLTPVNEKPIITVYKPPINDFSQYGHLQDWQTLISEKFGVEIEVVYISPLHQSGIATADYYPAAIRDGDVRGLIQLNVGDYVNLAVLRDEGLILPLDEYLLENEVYQSLPGAMKSAFILPDGKTWAFSTESPYGIYSRNIRTEWLENLGLDVPVTLDQLYEVSKAFAYDDPNKNGATDEHGMDINIRTSARMLMDIFTANDCFLSSYSSCSISYDPSTGAYEDAVLKLGMTESLMYIKSLHDEGILHKNMNWDFMDREGFGNFYDLSYFFEPEDNWNKIYTFNPGTDYPSVIALKPDSCFVLTSNVENPESMLNAFINTFMGSTEGMVMGLFGMPEINYSTAGNSITQITPFSNSESIRLTGLNVNLLENENVEIESPFYGEGMIESLKNESRVIEDFFSKNMLITDSWFLPHSNYKNAQRGFSQSFYSYLMDIDSISTSDFVEFYKKKALEAGYDEILNDLNNDAGTIAVYSYGD